MPTPRPEIAVTAPAVERPGEKTSSTFCARVICLDRLAADQAQGERLPDQGRAVDAAAVVAISIRIWLPAWRAETGAAGLAGLPAVDPILGRLEAMVDRVADDMGQRIADHLEHLAIELDVAAVHFEPDLLAELGGKIADHARQRRKQAVDPLHSGAGDGVADLGDAAGHALESRLDRDVARHVAQAAGELVAGKHRIRDAAHHPVEQIDREPDAAHRLATLAPDPLGRRGHRAAGTAASLAQ